MHLRATQEAPVLLPVQEGVELMGGLVTISDPRELRRYWGVRSTYPPYVTAAPELWSLWLDQEIHNPYVKPGPPKAIRTKKPKERALPVTPVKAPLVFERVLSEQEITYWMKKRDDAREAGHYDEADSIRDMFRKHGYRIKDGIDGSTLHGLVR